MTYIYRVENKVGKGCYRDLGDRHDTIASILKMENSVRRPSPSVDEGIDRFPMYEEICGFKTKVQALKWFTKGQLLLLEEFGFKLVRIKVERITKIGRTQVLAIK